MSEVREAVRRIGVPLPLFSLGPYFIRAYRLGIGESGMAPAVDIRTDEAGLRVTRLLRRCCRNSQQGSGFHCRAEASCETGPDRPATIRKRESCHTRSSRSNNSVAGGRPVCP